MDWYHVLADDESEANIKLSGTMIKAFCTIIVADAVMPLIMLSK